MKIDLGCGETKPYGYIGVDKIKTRHTDVVADLDEKLPFDDGVATEIRAWNVLEHINDLDFTMREIWRITKQDGKVVISVPHFSGHLAFYEYHKRFFNVESFIDWTKTTRIANSHPGEFKMESVKIKFMYFDWFFGRIFNCCRKAQLIYDLTFLHNLFPAVEMHFVLRKAIRL